VVLTTRPELVAAAVYGKVPTAALEAEGGLRIVGDRAVFEQFTGYFHLPEKVGLEASP
jgi:hypothetical protein